MKFLIKIGQLLIILLLFNCNNKNKQYTVKKVFFNIYKKEINFVTKDEYNLPTGLPYIAYFVEVNNSLSDTIVIIEKLIELRKKNISSNVNLYHNGDLENRTDDIKILPNSKVKFKIIPELCLLPELKKNNYHFYERICDSSMIIIKYKRKKLIKEIKLNINSNLKTDYYLNSPFYRKKLHLKLNKQPN